jgi:type I restriction enzyme, S subunit
VNAVKLADVCEIAMGQAPAGESYNADREGFPLVAGASDFGPLYPEAKKFTTAPTKLSSIGDVIVGIRATIGVKVLADRVYCLGRGVAGLRPTDRLDTRYLWQWLEFAAPELASKGRGATFKQVNRADIGEMEIPLPAVSEQRRIAAILDRADALRAKRREAFARLDELAQSIFIDMFGNPATNPKRFPVGPLGDLLGSAQYGTSEKSSTAGKYPVLRMNNITYQGQVDLTDLKFMDLPDDKVDRFTVTAGDILFNRTNSAELVGKTAVYRGTERLAYAGYLVRLRTTSGHSPEYISAFLNSAYGKAVLRGMCKSIVGMANINAREVQSIQMMQPPPKLQAQFADRISAIEGQKSVQLAALSECDALFASLQSRAFRGEL